MYKPTPRTALAILALSALALAACGSDDADSTAAPDSSVIDPVTTDGDAASGTPTAAELVDRAFKASDVTGHELVDGSTITLTFLADLLSAQGGCNSQSGGFQIEDGALVAGQLASTMMACDTPLMDQDTWLSEFLSSSPTIALDGSTLTLTAGDVTITLDEIQPAPIEETTWKVTGIVANDAVSSVPADSEASITIGADGTVQIHTGCNTGSGTVEVTDDTLTFGPIATTRMACEPELMDLEVSVTSVLDGEVGYTIEGDTLSLRSGTGADAIGLDLTAQS